ncbi:MAG: discoidin domain-containing protein [Planctomycetes bacterium]|nr:discoidin domain-containing protein [Planctomycetota bacterium]
MKCFCALLAAWLLLISPAVAGILYIEGPNERGEGPLPPAAGSTIETLGLFFVDIYAADMPAFAAFQATLAFLDEALVDAAENNAIIIAYNNVPPAGGARWQDWQITWNTTFLPQISDVYDSVEPTFGLVSTEQEGGEYVDKSITSKTWLMTVGYWYFPGVEGETSKTYTIGADAADTVFGDTNAGSIPFDVVTGSVTIGTVPFTLTVESTPATGAAITGDKPGTANYSAACDDQEAVALTAPREHSGGYFVRWKDASGSTLTYHGTHSFTVDADTTVIAEYGAVTDFYVNDGTPEPPVAAGDDANPGTSPEAPMTTIQTLLDRYPNIGAGCTVHVSDGTYVENISIGAGHSGLTLQGAGHDVTTIDGNQNGSCLRLDGFAGGAIAGFMITDGSASGATPNNCGGGIYSNNSYLTISDNTIAGNTAAGSGGGIYCEGSSAIMRSNTITGNTAGDSGGGFYCSGLSFLMSNIILWGNTAPTGPQLWMSGAAIVAVSYSDVSGGEAGAYVGAGSTLSWGSGNIDADPLFADPEDDDYHLKSVRGRWDPGSQGWVTDSETSPCIDAGDSASNYSTEPDPNGGRINMGAYGDSGEASKSPPAAIDDLAASLSARLSVASASSSSVLYNRFVAANAIDGSPGTFWSSGFSSVQRTENLTLYLGDTQNISRVRLLPRSSYPGLFPGDFTIDVSEDGDNWTQVISESGYVGESGVWYEKSFGARDARYVRLTGPNMPIGDGRAYYYMQIAEFEAHAPIEQDVVLLWTAPGDDGYAGTAAGYDIRYSTSQITAPAVWNAATAITSEPDPQAAGAGQSMTISLSDLPAGTRLYFGIRTTSQSGYESRLSDSPFVDTPEPMVPSAVVDLAASVWSKLSASSETGSSSLYNRFVAANATDDNPNTFWSCEGTATPQAASLTLDLGTTQLARIVRLLPRDGFPGLFPTDFTIEVSTNATDWTQVVSETAYTAESGYWYDKTFGAANARYVRVAVPATMLYAPVGLHYVQIAEFEVCGLAAFTAKGAASSGDLYNRFVAANATDGNTATFWSSEAGVTSQAAGLTLDLGSVRAVGRIRWLPRPGFPQLFPSSFTIEASSNGFDWTQVAAETGYVAESGVWYEKLLGSVSARYIRLYGDTKLYAPNGFYYMQMAELNACAPADDVVGLSWTAPGDTVNTGTAASYEVRYSTQEITDQATWDAATSVSGQPLPQAAASDQSMTTSLSLLPADARVYFAIRTTSHAGSESAISNSPYVDTPSGGAGATRLLASRRALPGDANGDCRVNIMDIIFVKARLGQDIHTGGNRKADVNQDGFIDVFDMIYVRGRLGAACQ